MDNVKEKEERVAYWPLPKDLSGLHDFIIDYSVRIQAACATQFQKSPDAPIAHGALLNLQRAAVTNHRAIRVLCETGWTPICPTLIRTLLDVLASTYVIVTKHEDSEFMAFKFLGSYLIQAINDPDTSEELRKFDSQQLENLRKQLKGADIKRVEEFIAKFKPQAYWFRPEYWTPGKIFQDAMPTLFPIYREFSGSVHGSFIGSLLFSDDPDNPSINPQENSKRARSAVVASSRILLDISWARGTFDGVADGDEYRHIVKTLILPQKEKVQGPNDRAE